GTEPRQLDGCNDVCRLAVEYLLYAARKRGLEIGIFCTIHTLRLHFEEHLPLVVAGRRLGVPKSTVCSMFVRFRKAGLSWPLPAGMSERE
ncbi:hypothetical protein ACSUZ5_004703, partial [Shigella sonnei]